MKSQSHSTIRLFFKNILSVILVIIFSGVIKPILSDDWPQWRGTKHDGKSNETGLLKQWPEAGPDLAWKAKGVGIGYSSISIANGMIYTLGDLDDGSYTIALNELNGDVVWKTKIGEAGGHKGYPGPRSTPTVNNGQVFVLNQYSDLVCLDAKTGKKVWAVNLAKDFNAKMMSGWKYSESPLVDGDQVICTPGGKEGTLIALHRKDGKLKWRTKDWTDPAGYSSVIVETIHGKRQYVQLTGKSVVGIDPSNGKILWKADRAGKTAVVTTPVVKDDIVFVTSAYGIGCNAFRIGKDGSTKQLYANTDIANHHGGVILHKGHIYGSSGRSFSSLNIETGKLNFKGKSVGKGATVFADGYLYLRSETGPVAIIEATPKGFNEVSRFSQPERSKKKAWAHPVVANGKLYLRDQDILLCYNIKK